MLAPLSAGAFHLRLREVFEREFNRGIFGVLGSQGSVVKDTVSLDPPKNVMTSHNINVKMYKDDL